MPFFFFILGQEKKKGVLKYFSKEKYFVLLLCKSEK